MCGTDRDELARQLLLRFQPNRLIPARHGLSTFGGMNCPKRRIETVRVGNAAVKIYRRTRTVDGNPYPTFEVCDYTDGRRRLRSFADHQAAQREAGRIAGLLAKGDAVAAALSDEEEASFTRCRSSADRGRPTGTGLRQRCRGRRRPRQRQPAARCDAVLPGTAPEHAAADPCNCRPEIPSRGERNTQKILGAVSLPE